MAAPPVLIKLIKKKKTDDSGILHLRVGVPKKRDYRYKSLAYRIPEKVWEEETMTIGKLFGNHAHLNQNIHAKRTRVADLLLKADTDGVPLTAKYIDSILEQVVGGKSSTITFMSVAQQWLEESREEVIKDGKKVTRLSEGTIITRTSLVNSLQAFAGDTPLSSVDAAWLKSLEKHFALTMDFNTTLPHRMGKVKEILKLAPSGSFNASLIDQYKWRAYKQPDRPYLTISQTEAIAQRLYAGEFDHRPNLQSVAAYFLVECWSGLRFSDWSRFTVETLIDTPAIRVRTKKNGEPVYVPLHRSPRLSKVVDYIKENNLQATISEPSANSMLKEVAYSANQLLKKNKEQEIEFDLTTHVGRHTCATLLLELGYSLEAVAEQLGISLKTVMLYAKTTRRKLRKEYDERGGL